MNAGDSRHSPHAPPVVIDAPAAFNAAAAQVVQVDSEERIRAIG